MKHAWPASLFAFVAALSAATSVAWLEAARDLEDDVLQSIPIERQPARALPLPVPAGADYRGDKNEVEGRSAILRHLYVGSRIPFLHIANIEVYAPGRIGERLEVSPGMVSLYQLLCDPRATEALEEILELGTPAGRLYALAGLYEVDSAKYQVARAQLGADTETQVKFQLGCIIDSVSLDKGADLADYILKNH